MSHFVGKFKVFSDKLALFSAPKLFLAILQHATFKKFLVCSIFKMVVKKCIIYN